MKLFVRSIILGLTVGAVLLLQPLIVFAEGEIFGACIWPATDVIESEANVTEQGCAPGANWVQNTPNVDFPLGLCKPVANGSDAEANVTADGCAQIDTWIANSVPAVVGEVSTNSGQNPAAKITEPQVKVPIPGLHFTSPKDILSQALPDGTNQPLYIPYIAEYIRGVYEYAIILAGVLAMVMIIVSGFQWAASGGNSDAISGAKTRIGQAVTGLIIALGSYTLLATLNPALVNLVPLKINTIDAVNLDSFLTPSEQFVSDEDLDKPQEFGTVDPNTLAKIVPPSNVELHTKTMYLLPATLTAFLAAMKDMDKEHPDYIVTVQSSFRSADDQYRIFKTYNKCPSESTLPDNVSASELIPKYCKNTANTRAGRSLSRVNGQFRVPATSGHFAGNALDLQIKVDTKKYVPYGVPCVGAIQDSKGVNTEYGVESCVAKEAQELIGIMLRHGFCIAINKDSKRRESWHFELVEPSQQSAKVYSSWCVRAGTPYATNDSLRFANF